MHINLFGTQWQKTIWKILRNPAFERPAMETRMVIRNGIAVLNVGLAFNGIALSQT